MPQTHAHKKSATANPDLQTVVILTLAGQSFALPLEELMARTSRDAMLGAPGLPPVIAGFLRHDEHLYPLVQLQLLFHTEALAPPAKPGIALLVRIPIEERPSKVLGLLVDEVRGPFTVEALALYKTNTHFLLSSVTHHIAVAADIYPLISPAALLEDIEDYCQNHLLPAEASAPLRRRSKIGEL